MAVAAVVTDWSGDRYVNGNNQSLTQYMTKARVESNMNTADYVLAAFTLNTTNGVSVTYKNKGYNFTVTITDSGNSAKVTYEGEGEPAEVKEWIENEDGSVTDGEVTLQVGDYINYDPITGASRTTYTSYGTATGLGEGTENDQTFNLADYTGKWKIFGVENGKIQIIPEDEILTTDSENPGYYLYGATGLKNAVTELDKISALYGQGEYAESARSVNHQDVADAIGLTPEVWNNLCDMMEESQPGSSLMKYGNEVSIFWDGDGTPRYESTLAGNGNFSGNHDYGFYWYDFETETIQKIDYTTTPSEEPIITMTNEMTAYVLESGLLEIPEKTFSMVFQRSNGSSTKYWLGSRYSFVYHDYAYFGVYSVNGGSVGGDRFVNSTYGENGWGNGVRPLVSLQSNIKLELAEDGSWNISAS